MNGAITMPVTRIKPLYDRTGKLKGYVDKYTGEEFGFPVIVGRKRNPYGKGWVMNSQEAMVSLAKDKDIKGETHRVLWFIGGILDFENWVQISNTEIANELDLKRQAVSRAMKVLEDKQIILRGPKVGRSYAFMLNPNFGWKGKVTNLEDYRRQEWDNDTKRSKALAVVPDQEASQSSSDQAVEEVSHHSPEIDELSQQFDIPTEKLKKLLKYFQSTQASPAES
jgi:DNA-binding transcriptional regulator GbsR (MarR family)